LISNCWFHSFYLSRDTEPKDKISLFYFGYEIVEKPSLYVINS